MFFFSSRRRHTSWPRDWSSDVCSSDLWSSTGSKGTGSTVIQALISHKKPAELFCVNKIGRASCRERVKVFVVDVSTKKTNLVATLPTDSYMSPRLHSPLSAVNIPQARR